jgi:radical SAM superfamily enzyme YgiQ (UPF0313 family)
MASVLLDAGHESNIIYFKIPREFSKDKPHPDPIGYEVIGGHHLLSGSVKDDNPWTKEEESLLIDRLVNSNPDIIGFSTRSLFDRFCIPLLKNIQKALPKKIIVAGGYGPMLNTDFYLEAADYVAFGEGEGTILNIANFFEQGKPLTNIHNLIFKQNGRVIHNAVSEPGKKIAEINYRNTHQLEIFCIDNNREDTGDPAAPDMAHESPVLAGRGCAGSCSYCSAGQWEDLHRQQGCRIRSRRLRSVESIIEELKQVKARGYRELYFLDSYLVGPKSFLMELFEQYREQIALPFSANLYPKQIARFPNILDAACKAGLQKVVLGIQHGSEDFRRNYFNRAISNQQLLDIARMYHERKIQTEYHVIAGIPFESEESFEESLDFISKLPMDHAFLLVFRLNVFPNSPLSQKIEDNGLPMEFNQYEWLFRGLLYYLRTLASDSQFYKFRNRLRDYFSENRQQLYDQNINLIDVIDLISRGFKENHMTSFGPLEILTGVYKEYLKEWSGETVLVWGAGSGFQDYKSLFDDVSIGAFIDSDPEKEGQKIDGITVQNPSFLKNQELPVFICSHYKKEIYQQLRKDYPHISLIP